MRRDLGESFALWRKFVFWILGNAAALKRISYFLRLVPSLTLPKSTLLYRFWICIDAEVAYSLSLHQKPAELLELPELHGAQVTNSEPFDRCSLI